VAFASWRKAVKGVPNHVLYEFMRVCHDAAKRGLVRCSSGNLSRRLDGVRFLATATGSWMEDLTGEQVSLCATANGAPLQGPKPTMEIGFHAGILRTRPDVDVVLHFQSPYATALACGNIHDINYFVIPEIPFHIGPIARIPFLIPGSKELAHAVTEAMRDHDMVVIGNHGMVTVAVDYGHAIQNADLFEFACQILVCNGRGSEPILKEDVQRILNLRRDASEGV
jgi:ribulose-5-phosphate 4-epimerase/fuculose-1-phosphate aldolase